MMLPLPPSNGRTACAVSHTRQTGLAMVMAPRLQRVASKRQISVAAAPESKSHKIEPFVGANCYYLLDKMTQGDTKFVEDTLRFIKSVGCTVVRTWAFNESKDPTLQKATGPNREFINPKALQAMDDLLELTGQIGGLKLMLCLTNCVPDYGGLWKYISWAQNQDKQDQPPFNDYERYKFWAEPGPVTSPTGAMNGKAMYQAYINFIVNRYKEKYANVIHSWDLCNEPRNIPDGQAPADTEAIAKWVDATAVYIKSNLDPQHPVTVGSEGFYGPWKGPNAQVQGNLLDLNPYPGWTEGANWQAEASTAIDFACIHPYWDQWHGEWSPQQWLDGNKLWIDKHVDVARTMLGGKPVVVQEFNMPDKAPRQLRLDYFDFVTDRLQNGELTGAMVWMLAAEGYYNDGYTMYPSSKDEIAALSKMCEAVRTQPAKGVVK